MNRITVLGVCPLSDQYPNIKYRLPVLAELFGKDYREIIHEVSVAGLYQEVAAGQRAGKLLRGMGYTLATLWVFLRFLVSRSANVYLCYPGVFLALLFSLLPKGWRPKIYLDGFISLYDAAVNDRAMLPRDGTLASLLFRLEARAFRTADRIIVDTRQNAGYYRDLFSLPEEKLVAIPLSIPPLREQRRPYHPPGGEKFICTFIGTLVPLQGIRQIIDAAAMLADLPDMEFRIIGDGQDGAPLRHALDSGLVKNVQWIPRMLSTPEVVAELQHSTLCLGIFGSSDKAKRVVSYKLYYYMALGLPFITRRTAALEDLTEAAQAGSILLLTDGQAQSLADRIRHLYHQRQELQDGAAIAAALYDAVLSREHIKAELAKVFVN